MPEAGKRDRGADEGNGTHDGGTDNSDKGRALTLASIMSGSGVPDCWIKG